MDERAFTKLESFLHKVPGIVGMIGKRADDDGLWWMQSTIDNHHPLARNVVFCDRR
jgi:hypothetical protein